LRDQILSEIQRLARANSGRPPGSRAFERETGIRSSEWLGRYWARWGDAVKEAGFEPNTLNQRSNSNSILLKLVEAVRHYQKLPTTKELRMYARGGDTEFPSHNTFFNHFRNKAGMLSKLRELIAEHPEFDDITPFLPPEMDAHEGQGQSAKQAITIQREGFVYLLKSGIHYKIGRSDEIERRVKEIRVALPEVATLVHSIRTDDPPGIEAYWHRRFADRRANGEWFKLSSSDVAAFKRRKYQ
jgi:hypothetical protein